MKTRIVKPKEIVEKWYVVDAKGQRLGNLASFVAQLLMGKGDPMTRNYLVPKTKVVILNSDDLDITEKKAISKLHTRYSGFPGGLTISTLGELMEKDSRKVVTKAVRGMLPKNKRADEIISSNLYIYNNAEHDQAAQASQMVTVDIQKFKI
jgi:large subunit ribosomal protein L13